MKVKAPIISFTIPGPPYAQKRARATNAGKFARVHDHPDNKSWAGRAQVHMLEAMKGRKPFTGPVRLTITAMFACPKSKHRKRTPVPEQWSNNAKDISNCVKAVEDAGNGILWVDDRQAVWLRAFKRQAAQGAPPAVYVSVCEVVDYEEPAADGPATGSSNAT